jgi:iron complex transport system ATP-binding protein
MLQLEGLSVRYGSRMVLRDVSLDVHAGEVVALIGPNGAGKSTLLRAASGLVHPTSGRVTCGGEDISKLPERMRARRLAVVPQASREGGAFTVKQTVMLGRTSYLGWTGRPSEEDERRVAEALRITDLKRFTERRVAELSGGEQQRVLIARALAQAASVLLMDEPSSNLDLQYQAGLLELIRSLAEEGRYAVLLALHDLNLVARVADRVALLLGGELVAVGELETVMTEDWIRRAFQTEVRVIWEPPMGYPHVVLAAGNQKGRNWRTHR